MILDASTNDNFIDNFASTADLLILIWIMYTSKGASSAIDIWKLIFMKKGSGVVKRKSVLVIGDYEKCLHFLWFSSASDVISISRDN